MYGEPWKGLEDKRKHKSWLYNRTRFGDTYNSADL